MADQLTTAEQPVSHTKEEIIKEAQRIEEATLYTSKGHFAAAHFWLRFHLWIGVPTVIMSSIVSASSQTTSDNLKAVGGIFAIAIAAFTAVMTFLNPNERANAHLNAGNEYDALQNRVRIFRTIDCWRESSEEVLTEKLKYFSQQKEQLNKSCPQVPWFAYQKAKKGIAEGEGRYRVDNSPPAPDT